MKKQITLTLLGLLTMVGGSWLAAQQRESVRTTGRLTTAKQDEPAEANEKRPAADPARARRPSASADATQRPIGSRPAQETRPADERYREDAAVYPVEALEYREVAVAGQQLFQPILARTQRMNPEDAARMRAFQDAIKELRESESEDEKAAAREHVTKLVSEQLEVDLENREKELSAIEQRAKELRKQLEERKTAKPELLKMLVMLIDNPQVGLGIPPEWMQMLMRGQNDRFSINSPFSRPMNPPEFPSAPLQPAMPPQAVSPAYFDAPDGQPVDSTRIRN